MARNESYKNPDYSTATASSDHLPGHLADRNNLKSFMTRGTSQASAITPFLPLKSTSLPDTRSVALQSQDKGNDEFPLSSAAKQTTGLLGGSTGTLQVGSMKSSPVSSGGKNENEEPSANEQKILVLLRQSLLPFSDRLDPFAQLPTTLTRFQEHLVSFYLLYYPKVTYGLSARLQPHPVATNFAIAMNMPACFQVALARSALYRLSLQKYSSDKERSELELAMIRHKGEAIRLVREMSSRLDKEVTEDGVTAYDKFGNVRQNPLSSTTRSKDRDALIASIISLGTLDRRTGSENTASIHFNAVRRLIRSAGGPLGINSVLLSRVMVHFECIYGTTTGSYVWDPKDFSGLLNTTNSFFAQVWDLWMRLSELSCFSNRDDSCATSVTASGVNDHNDLSQHEQHNESSSYTKSNQFRPFDAFALSTKSTLRASLSRPTQPADGSEEPNPQQCSNLIFQITCLLTVAHIVVDYLAPLPTGPPSLSTASHRSKSSTSSNARASTKSGTNATNSSNSNSSAGASPASTHSSASSILISPTDLSMLHSYITPLVQSIERTNLLHQPCNNHMWLLQVGDQSSQHSRRIWRAASFVWVLRHVNWRVQNMVKEWLLDFLTGEKLGGEENHTDTDRDNEEGHAGRRANINDQHRSEDATKGQRQKESRKPLRLNSFHFSYAS